MGSGRHHLVVRGMGGLRVTRRAVMRRVRREALRRGHREAVHGVGAAAVVHRSGGGTANALLRPRGDLRVGAHAVGSTERGGRVRFDRMGLREAALLGVYLRRLLHKLLVVHRLGERCR